MIFTLGKLLEGVNGMKITPFLHMEQLIDVPFWLLLSPALSDTPFDF